MKKIFGFLILAVSVVLISCEKEPDIQVNQELSEKSAVMVQDEIAVSNAQAEVCYEADFYANAERAILRMAKMGSRWNWKNILRYKFRQCPDVSIDSTDAGYPITITLNYGDGVELNNGRVLSGVITVVISAPPKTDGATKTVTYDNFSVDSIRVSGTSEFMFVGDNETTRMQIHTGNLSFTMPDGTVIDREINKTHEWLAGVETPEDMTDDIIQITGSVEVSVSTGEEYFKEITTPIIKLGDCRWFVEGVVEISVDGETTIVIDYGDGECDNVATVTKDGTTTEIDLSGKNPKVRNNNRNSGNNGNKGNNGNGKGGN